MRFQLGGGNGIDTNKWIAARNVSLHNTRSHCEERAEVLWSRDNGQRH